MSREAIRYALLALLLFAAPALLRGCAVIHACRDGLCR